MYFIELYRLIFWHSTDDVLPIGRGWLCFLFSSPASCNGPQHLVEQFTHPSSFFTPLSYWFRPFNQQESKKSNHVADNSYEFYFVSEFFSYEYIFTSLL